LNPKTAQIEEKKTGIVRVYSDLLISLNEKFLSGFLEHYDKENVKRTHLFNGRYENIYLNGSHIPELKTFLSEVCSQAGNILDTTGIKAGYWFNYMPPGAVTTLHSHDDDDELLSAVYYIKTPESSGDLIIHSKTEKLTIHPEAGMLVFFKPDIKHEVTENKSSQGRLSIGINFGKQTT